MTELLSDLLDGSAPGIRRAGDDAAPARSAHAAPFRLAALTRSLRRRGRGRHVLTSTRGRHGTATPVLTLLD